MSELKEVPARGEKTPAAKGDNADKVLRNYVEQVAKKANAITGIRGEIKDVLNDAKNDGFSKMAIRKAVKELNMTPEQLQSRKEVDEEKRRYMDLCRDLPLFKKAA